MINLGKVQEWENIEKTKISSFPSVPQVSQSTDDAKRSEAKFFSGVWRMIAERTFLLHQTFWMPTFEFNLEIVSLEINIGLLSNHHSSLPINATDQWSCLLIMLSLKP